MVCIACRNRKVKCDETKPICTRCTQCNRKCLGYCQNAPLQPPKGWESYPNTSSTAYFYNTKPPETNNEPSNWLKLYSTGDPGLLTSIWLASHSFFNLIQTDQSSGIGSSESQQSYAGDNRNYACRWIHQPRQYLFYKQPFHLPNHQPRIHISAAPYKAPLPSTSINQTQYRRYQTSFTFAEYASCCPVLVLVDSNLDQNAASF